MCSNFNVDVNFHVENPNENKVGLDHKTTSSKVFIP